MKSFDPTSEAPMEETSIVFASAQFLGRRKQQEDRFSYFKDECFVVADGVGGLPHGDIAAQLAVDTAIWGYKHIRLRPFYWDDKRLFMRRIFRSVNIAVWQKHREPNFSGGLATTMSVVMIGTKFFWLGNVGDSRAYLYQRGEIQELTHDDSDEYGFLTNALGVKRYGIASHFRSGVFTKGDSIILGTDGLTRFVSADNIKKRLAMVGDIRAELETICRILIDQAMKAGSDDNITVCIIKRSL